MFQKPIRKAIIFFPFILTIFIMACGSSKQDIANFETDKREMRTKIQNAIAQIDKSIDTAGVRLDTLGQQTKIVYDSVVQDLKGDKAKLQKKLSDLDTTSQTQWQEFKADAGRDINHAYNKIKNLDSKGIKKSE